MQIKLNKKQAGVVLLVALFTIVAAGIIIAGYLTLMNSESRIVSRSQIWNQCVPVMEAGVEEAMAQIQYTGYSTNFSSNNWNLSNGYYQKRRTNITDGSYYIVRILPAIPPTLYSTAYVPVPATTNYISRQVRVTTVKSTVAPGGVFTKGPISLGGGILVDSYDSSIGAYDAVINGVTNVNTNSLVLTDSTNSGAISFSGSGTIEGTAAVGPGGSLSYGNNVTIGPAGSSGVASGWTAADANMQINDVSLPPNFSPTPMTGGTYPLLTGVLYDTGVLFSGNYVYTGNLSMSSADMIGVFGNAVLYINGSISMSAQSEIYIAPGASLTIYVSGSASFGGQGIENSSQVPSNLHVYGLPSCTSITYSGGNNFYGVMDAPEAAVTLSGNASFYGSITANTFSASGGGSIHYDQSLGRPQFYMAGSWNEL